MLVRDPSTNKKLMVDWLAVSEERSGSGSPPLPSVPYSSPQSSFQSNQLSAINSGRNRDGGGGRGGGGAAKDGSGIGKAYSVSAGSTTTQSSAGELIQSLLPP